MAIKKCKECGGDVSTTATACPHCGAKSFFSGCGCLLLGLIFVVLFFLIVPLFFM